MVRNLIRTRPSCKTSGLLLLIGFGALLPDWQPSLIMLRNIRMRFKPCTLPCFFDPLQQVTRQILPITCALLCLIHPVYQRGTNPHGMTCLQHSDPRCRVSSGTAANATTRSLAQPRLLDRCVRLPVNASPAISGIASFLDLGSDVGRRDRCVVILLLHRHVCNPGLQPQKAGAST